jgi:hypothetical protein
VGGTDFGTKTITETGEADWQLVDIDCVPAGQAEASNESLAGIGGTTDIKVDPGDVITCTFVNKKDATVTIVKDADPNSTQSFAFTGSFDGFSLSDPTSGDDANDDTSFTVSGAGFESPDKSVTETVPVAGWDLTAIDCNDTGVTFSGNTTTGTASFTVNPGDTIVCTFTNETGSLEVTKLDNGLAATAQFTFRLTGGPDDIDVSMTTNCGALDPAPCDGTVTTNVLLFPNLRGGTYELCETGMPPNYAPGIGTPEDPCETIELEQGEDRAVTVDNIPCPPGESGVLTISKTISATVGHPVTFTFDVDGPNEFDTNPDPTITFNPGDPLTKTVEVTPLNGVGTYTVDEGPPPPPYGEPVGTNSVEITVTGDCEGTVFLTNSFAPGEVSLIKQHQFGSGTPVNTTGHWIFYLDGPDGYHQGEILNEDGNTFATEWTGLVPEAVYTLCEKQFKNWIVTFNVTNATLEPGSPFRKSNGDWCVSFMLEDGASVSVEVLNTCPNARASDKNLPKAKKKKKSGRR